MTDVDLAREIDRALNASRDPAEMKRLISRRRLIRAGMDFDHAMRQFEPRRPDPRLLPLHPSLRTRR